jgi:hypothetical protein
MAPTVRTIVATEDLGGTEETEQLKGCSITSGYDVALFLTDRNEDGNLCQAAIQSRLEPQSKKDVVALIKQIRTNPSDTLDVSPPQFLLHQVVRVPKDVSRNPTPPTSSLMHPVDKDCKKYAQQPTLKEAKKFLQVVSANSGLHTTNTFPAALDPEDVVHVAAWALHLLKLLTPAERFERINEAYKLEHQGEEHPAVNKEKAKTGDLGHLPPDSLNDLAAKVLQSFVDLRLSSLTATRRLGTTYMLLCNLLSLVGISDEDDRDHEDQHVNISKNGTKDFGDDDSSDDDKDVVDLSLVLTAEDRRLAATNLTKRTCELQLLVPVSFNGSSSFLSEYEQAACDYHAYKSQNNLSNAASLTVLEKSRSLTKYIGCLRGEELPWYTPTCHPKYGSLERLKLVVGKLVPAELAQLVWKNAQSTYEGNRGKLKRAVTSITKARILATREEERDAYINAGVPESFQAAVRSEKQLRDVQMSDRLHSDLYYVVSWYSTVFSYFEADADALFRQWAGQLNGLTERQSLLHFVYQLIDCLYFPTYEIIVAFAKNEEELLIFDDKKEHKLETREARCGWRKVVREISLCQELCTIQLSLENPMAQVGKIGQSPTALCGSIVKAMMEKRIAVATHIKNRVPRGDNSNYIYPDRPLSAFSPLFLATVTIGPIYLKNVFELLGAGSKHWEEALYGQRPFDGHTTETAEQQEVPTTANCLTPTTDSTNTAVHNTTPQQHTTWSSSVATATAAIANCVLNALSTTTCHSVNSSQSSRADTCEDAATSLLQLREKAAIEADTASASQQNTPDDSSVTSFPSAEDASSATEDDHDLAINNGSDNIGATDDPYNSAANESSVTDTDGDGNRAMDDGKQTSKTMDSPKPSDKNHLRGGRASLRLPVMKTTGKRTYPTSAANAPRKRKRATKERQGKRAPTVATRPITRVANRTGATTTRRATRSAKRTGATTTRAFAQDGTGKRKQGPPTQAEGPARQKIRTAKKPYPNQQEKYRILYLQMSKIKTPPNAKQLAPLKKDFAKAKTWSQICQAVAQLAGLLPQQPSAKNHRTTTPRSTKKVHK